MEKHNLVKEQYVVDLLGYNLVQYSDGYWNIFDKNGKKVGYTIYEKVPCCNPRYLTIIYKNNITYEDSRTSDADRFFHYSFENRAEVIMNLGGLDKCITIWLNVQGITYPFELSWNNYGFKIELGEFIRETENSGIHRYGILERASHTHEDEFSMCSYYSNIGLNKNIGKMNAISIEEFIEKGDVVRLLDQFNCIMSQLFDKSLVYIIGEDDLEQSGLKKVFEKIEKNDKSVQKKYGVRK